ncbi:hypothetical protein GCM10009127_19490 [Alteraurantiacibacter aestuarii]|uniref:M48 family metalloprotease n=1 Tax=Alteraurantiacibacter aestuarii TaxID=650004 RepID=UPI0031DDFC50
MLNILPALVAAIMLAAPLPASAQVDDATAALRVQDLRLARISERMLAANVTLCNATMPLTGMILHSRDQYSDQQAGWFTNGDVTIASVLPGSPAQLAGLQENDGIAALNAVAVDALARVEGEPRRDTVFDWIAAQESATLAITYRRGAQTHEADLAVPRGCRALVEILTENGKTARSDGRVIQISYGMAGQLNDDELAVVFAHELAHSVLEHRRRLVAAGVSKGLLGEIGRNQQLNRQVEVEADRLGVHLLANAGYDPMIAPQFWRSDMGNSAGGGMMRSWIYPSHNARADIVEREIQRHLPLHAGPSWPGHLLDLRERGFNEN